ncbi:MAG: hypothetical protein ACXWPI_14750, partial [Ktedonobacterales bacterium]
KPFLPGSPALVGSGACGIKDRGGQQKSRGHLLCYPSDPPWLARFCHHKRAHPEAGGQRHHQYAL